MLPALHVVEYTGSGGVAMLTDIRQKIPRRTAWLTERSYAFWRAGCGLKYWMVWLEEFPNLVAAMTDEECDDFKLTLKEIRSAGGRVFVSLQHFHHSDVADIGVVRCQFGRMTFGMMGWSECKRSLTDRQLEHEYAPGGAPRGWKASHPGRALIDVNGHSQDHPDDEFTARVVTKARARAAGHSPTAEGADTSQADGTAQDERILREAGILPEPGDENIDPRQPIVSTADPNIAFPAPPDPEPRTTHERARRHLLGNVVLVGRGRASRVRDRRHAAHLGNVGYTRSWAQKTCTRLLDEGLLERRAQVWILLPSALLRARDRQFVDA
ncbi:hypothetical protein ACIBG7_05150 [Nonomuraea sp. NPDC050328]|uniref:hypothetical protein n=1 Tax=Nonomuraea sp. NPDC050328 TaxID=3364361 RepID=UPI0037980523